ncbi:unnamed protein product, partial [Arabidopsis halleri]
MRKIERFENFSLASRRNKEKKKIGNMSQKLTMPRNYIISSFFIVTVYFHLA